MPGKAKKATTGWVIAAKVGATVDGRTITKQWIKDMADTYSLDEYTAVIWPEHYRSTWGPYEGKNWGTVDAVKSGNNSNGDFCLFVKLTANNYLLDANKDGQKLFMSIEPNPDFKASGKCYLQGLAVTDSPASTGTTRLKFSVGSKEVDREYSHLEELIKADFIFSDHNAEQSQSKEHKAKRLLTQLFSLFSNNETPLTIHSTEHSTEQAAGSPDNAEDIPMTPEQYTALTEKLDNVTTAVADVEDKFTALNEKMKTFSVQAAEAGAAQEEETPAAAITTEQFSALSDNITALTEKFTGLDTKFAALSQETGGQEPDPSGQGSSVNLV